MLFRSRSGGTRYIFASPGLASCRRRPLSSNVRPRMPTLTGYSPCFEIQQRAPRGTSAFAAFCQHFRLWRGVRSLCPTPQRSATGNAGLEASAPGCGQHGRGQAVQRRACRASVRNFSSGPAVASPARTVQGLTPRSSGVPTAYHQRPASGTQYIFASPGLASCRRRPLSSNVRPHKNHLWRPRDRKSVV